MKRILFLSDLGLNPLWVETIRPFIPEAFDLKAIEFPSVGMKNLPSFETRKKLQNAFEKSIEEFTDCTLFVHGLGVPLLLDYLQNHSGKFLRNFNGLIIYPKLNPSFETNDLFGFSPLDGIVGSITNLKLRKFISKYLNNSDETEKLSKLLNEQVDYKGILRLYEHGWESLLSTHDMEASVILSAEDKAESNQLFNLCKRSFKSLIIRRTPEWGYLPMLESPGDFVEEITILSSNLCKH
jgi:hypothetical protein